MLTRFVRIQLAIFTIVGIIGVFVMVVWYIQAPTLLGVGKMTVTLELPSSGSLYRFSNVTYRGVQIGKVTEIGLTPRGAKAVLTIDTSPKIPADLQAEVRSISAVGEQYVDLRPRTDSPPYLRDGSVITQEHVTMPQPIGPVLDQSSALINSIPKGKLSTLLDESFNAFNGAGYNFGSLFDSSAQISGDLNGVADQSRTLTEQTGPFLDAQAQTTDSIRLWARSLAGFTGQLAKNDPQFRILARKRARGLQRGVQAARPDQADAAGVARQSHHDRSDRRDLPRVPRAGAGVVAAVHRRGPVVPRYQDLRPDWPLATFNLVLSDPPACTVGFLPPSEWRSAGRYPHYRHSGRAVLQAAAGFTHRCARCP